MDKKNPNSDLVDLVEKLLNEALKKKSKKKGKEKMADKDYDGDGEVESSKDEYFGSRDKAIKKNMGKNAEKKEIVSKKKKKQLNEGRFVGNEQLIYGGFPKLINVVLSEDAEWSGEDPRKRLDAGKPARGQDYGIVDALRLMTTKIGHARSAGFKMANGEFPDEKMREETIKHLKNVSGNFVNSEAEVTDAYNFFRQHYPHLGVEDEIATKFDDIIKNHTPMPSEEE